MVFLSKPTAFVVLDGYGWRAEQEGNPVAQAHMPFFNHMLQLYPSALLHASGEFVGLPEGVCGNSEVGHVTLGAGRVVPAPVTRIHDAIESGQFFNHAVLLQNFEKIKQSGGRVHCIGLLSDAGVHSHIDHLFALLRVAHQVGVAVVVHAVLDGRDTPARSARTYLGMLDSCAQQFNAHIGSIQGRFYAMDRDKNWERTQAAYDMMLGLGRCEQGAVYEQVLAQQYAQGNDDEFIQPVLLDRHYAIKPGDGVIFFNVRPDRARQLTQAFIDPQFKQFPVMVQSSQGALQFFISLIDYDRRFADYMYQFLYEEMSIQETLLDVIEQNCSNQRKTFLIAETEKYAHVTYFFRGMRDEQPEGCQRVLVPSRKEKSYVHVPEMSAPQITQQVIDSLITTPHAFYLINYANADMVGHAGDIDATMQACQVLDAQLAALYEQVVVRMGGALYITADHGNAEEKNNRHTSHTLNPVPFLAIGSAWESRKNKLCDMREQKTPVHGLANASCTVLKSLGIAVPQVMEQESVF